MIIQFVLSICQGVSVQMSISFTVSSLVHQCWKKRTTHVPILSQSNLPEQKRRKKDQDHLFKRVTGRKWALSLYLERKNVKSDRFSLSLSRFPSDFCFNSWQTLNGEAYWNQRHMNRTLTVVLSLIIFDKMMMMMKESAVRDNVQERRREKKERKSERERLKLGLWVCARVRWYCSLILDHRPILNGPSMMLMTQNRSNLSDRQ